MPSVMPKPRPQVRLRATLSAEKTVCAGWLLASAVVLVAFLSGLHALRDFSFDDAYMFHRYAMNVRAGWGISWNPGGPHSYGLTSPLWLVPVLIGSFAGAGAKETVVWLSTGFSLVAVVVLGLTARRTARTPWIRTGPMLFGVLGVCLFGSNSFRACATNGMETMLAITAVCGLIIAAQLFVDRRSLKSAGLLAVLGLVCFSTRPESGLVAVVLPVTMWMSVRRGQSWRPILGYFGILAAIMGLYLLAGYLYFGTALPLPFYVKATHGYAGLILFPNSMDYLRDFVFAALPAIAVLALFSDGVQWRRVAVFLLPLLTVVAYLFSFRQIMGYDGRYFMPYLPLVFVPAMESLDRWWREERAASPFALLVSVAFLMPLLLPVGMNAVIETFTQRQRVGQTYYLPPVLSVAARQPLKNLGWMEGNRAFAAYVARLPGTPSLALTEAGIVGSSAPRDRILDMTGLNEKEIALHGPSIDFILGQQPDVIWIPAGAYTWLRGRLLADPRLLQMYEVYDGAFNYGVAIRKGAPRVYTEQLQAIWPEFYPGTQMQKYRVTNITWDGTPNVISR